MSINSISTDWFRNMALFSISNTLSGKSVQDDLFQETFTSILQNVLDESSASSQKGQLHFENNFSAIQLKDYSSLLHAPKTLQFTEGSFEKLDSILKGKLANMGEQFFEAGKKYNINPSLLASISIHETGNGSSRAAHEKLNVAGMMGKKGLKQYQSIEDSIFDMARNLRENYLNKGFDTIPKIGAKYAPVGASNDPTGLNNHWVKGVNNYFHSLI